MRPVSGPAWITCVSLESFLSTPGVVVGQGWHIGPNVDEELVTVDGKYGYGEPHRLVVLVECDAGVDEEGGVLADAEEGLFFVGCESSGDPVAVAGLADADLVGQVADAALFDVDCHEQLGGTLGDEVHEVKRELHGPWDAVYVTVLGPADALCLPRDFQKARNRGIGGYYRNPRNGARRVPVLFAHLGEVGGGLAAPQP